MISIGDPVPDVSCDACLTDGRIEAVSLEHYRDKWLALFFWPFDFTYVCCTYSKTANSLPASGNPARPSFHPPEERIPMHASHPISLLVAALVMLRSPCSRNKATAQLLLERAAAHHELSVPEREACLSLADELDVERHARTDPFEGARIPRHLGAQVSRTQT